MSRTQSEASSFRHALQGIGYTLRTEPHMRFHLAATLAVFVLAYVLGVPRGDWLWLMTAAASVMGAELVNTAIERAVDLASPERHVLAKAAKDTAAGAVLVASIFAAGVGLIVLAPPLWDLLSN